MYVKIFQKFRSLSVLVMMVLFLLEPALSLSAQAYTKVEFVKLNVSATTKNKAIALKWKALDKKKLDFDGYTILYKKGVHEKLEGAAVNNAYVALNSFNINLLTVGDWWSFQVVPVKLIDNEYVEVAVRSAVVQIQVKDKKDKPKEYEYVVISEDLLKPNITTPAKNKVLTQFPRTAYLAWDKVSGAKKYEIQFSCSGCDGAPAGAETRAEKWGKAVKYSTKQNHYLTPDLGADNYYRFRVRAVVRTGVEGEWSDYSYFRFDTSGLS